MSSGSSPDWAALGREHVWQPYTQMKTAPAPVPIASARGAWLETSDGRRILDGISSWWVNCHGHAHPRIAEAIARQASTLEHVIFAGFTHEPAARLAAELARVTPPGLERVFYTDDGSTAVEVGLKMAAQSWRNRGESREAFVALEHAYHGDTFGTMAAGGTSTFHEAFRPFLFAVERAPSPHPYAFDGREDPDACVAHCRQALGEILERRAGEVAGVIVEPLLQGAGGMIVWPPGYLSAVRELCDEHGTLLIADEVLTGFGRTGALFACDREDVRPDILCLSKAITGGFLPLGATLATDDVFAAFSSDDRSKTLFHGHSYTANPIACAAALASLAIFEEERVLERVQELERLFAAGLERLRRLPAVADVRGIGAVAAVEIGASDAGYLSEVGPRLARALLDRGILLRPLGNVFYLLPPYVITDEEVAMVFDALADEIGRLDA